MIQRLESAENIMLNISNELIARINEHVQTAYPEEGAGFLIGEEGEVKEIVALPNAREDEARHNRFLITPEDYLKAELTADSLGLSLIGVFHSEMIDFANSLNPPIPVRLYQPTLLTSSAW